MASELDNIRQLLTSVRLKNEKYAEVQKVYEESGVRYNIFDVLGLKSSEVRLHSSILASLFDSKEHGAGNAFLKAFLRIPKLKLPDDFMSSGPVQVETEKYLGPRTTTRGGRIDLFLSDGKDNLVIENKIYAGDQDNQLLRYHNEAPDAKLVYLTRYGEKPSKKSLGGLDPEIVTCLPYQTDIVDWLNNCVRIAANLPYIRETINQYIKTIQQLTNTDMPTNPEIIDIISQKENISAAFAIRENFNDAINNIMGQFIARMKERVKEEGLPFSVIGENGNWTDGDSGFYFVHPAWKGFSFGAAFDGANLTKLYIGFVKDNDIQDISQIEGLENIAKDLGYSAKTKNWYWKWATGPKPICKDWINAETMEAVIDGSMVERFIEILKRIHDYFEGLSI